MRDALELVDASMAEVWPLEPDDVTLAASLPERHPALSARDLTHLACCTRRGGVPIKTFDRGLAAAFP